MSRAFPRPGAGTGTETFVRRTRIEAPARAVWEWHAAPGALERLVPPWEPVEVLGPPGIAEGQEVALRVRVGPVPLLWVSRIVDVVPGERFRDIQVKGPFARWEHTHSMVPLGADASYLEDRIVYALPFGPLGRLGKRWVRRRLARMFDWRHRVTAEALAGGASAG